MLSFIRAFLPPVKDDDHLVWKHKGSILYVDEEELVDDSRYEMTADEEEGGKKIVSLRKLGNKRWKDLRKQRNPSLEKSERGKRVHYKILKG